MASSEVTENVSTTTTTMEAGDEKYTQGFMLKLHQLHEQKEFIDVTLKIEDLEIPCHWVVLSAASEYFHAMYKSGLKEAVNSIVEVSGTDSTTFKNIIRYIYTAQIIITSENVQGLIEACELYQLEKLKLKCEVFAVKSLQACNCIGFYKFAKLYNLEDLQCEARNAMLDKFKEVMQNAEFLQLSASDIIEYLSDEKLNVSNEDLVFESVNHWVKYDYDFRKKLFLQIIPNIRLPYCTNYYLCHTVEKSELMLTPECEAFLNEAKQSYVLPDFVHKTSSPRAIPRISHSRKQSLVAEGTIGNDQVYMYLEEKTSTWQKLLTNRSFQDDHDVNVAQNHIVNTGGCVFDTATSKCCFFTIQKKKWKRLPDMLNARYRHCSTVLGEGIYVLGGIKSQDDEQPLNTVEYLNLCSREQWEQRPEMIKALADPLVTTFHQYIYVMGGVDIKDQDSVDTQAYDSVLGKWQAKASMPKTCRGGAVVTLNNKLYVVGGYEKDCMCYDPSVDCWTQLQPPIQQHGGAPAIVWRGRILVSGGTIIDKNQKIQSSVIEEYNTETDQWMLSNLKLDKPLYSHHLVSINLNGC